MCKEIRSNYYYYVTNVFHHKTYKSFLWHNLKIRYRYFLLSPICWEFLIKICFFKLILLQKIVIDLFLYIKTDMVFFISKPLSYQIKCRSIYNTISDDKRFQALTKIYFWYLIGWYVSNNCIYNIHIIKLYNTVIIN